MTDVASVIIEKTTHKLESYNVMGHDVSSKKSLQISSEGAAAQSVNSVMLVQSANGKPTGLAADTCRTPNSDWWFTGIRTTSGYVAKLTLANPDNAEAIIGITAFNQDGELSAGPYRRVLVPANSIKVVDLTRVIPGETSGSIHVQGIEGRVTPSLEAEVLSGVNALGRTFIAPIATPTNAASIVAVSGKAEDVRLYILPTVDDAIVTVRIHAADGTFTLADAESLLLGAGETRVLDLSKSLGSANSSIEIQSDQPVIAAVSYFDVNGAVKDYEVQSAQPEIQKSVDVPFTSSMSSMRLAALSLTDSAFTVTIHKSGKILWSENFTLKADEYSLVNLKKEVPSGSLITISTESDGLYVSQIIRVKTGGATQSTVLGLVDPATQLVAGVRLHLNIS
jgi:hypothetical protein